MYTERKENSFLAHFTFMSVILHLYPLPFTKKTFPHWNQKKLKQQYIVAIRSELMTKKAYFQSKVLPKEMKFNPWPFNDHDHLIHDQFCVWFKASWRLDPRGKLIRYRKNPRSLICVCPQGSIRVPPGSHLPAKNPQVELPNLESNKKSSMENSNSTSCQFQVLLYSLPERPEY